MELYIPPPTAFLPKLPPPRPVVPAVPVVPPPDLPDILNAPEGAYVLNNALFPSIGTPAAPLPFDVRPTAPSAASFMGGGAGFVVNSNSAATVSSGVSGQTAMSFGSTVVNGQAQPAFPVKMSFVNVWFPPKTADQRGIGGLFGGKDAPAGTGAGGAGGAAPNMTGYEPSVSSDSDSPPSSDMPTTLQPMEVPAGALPAQQNKRMGMGMGMGMGFGKGNATQQGLPRPKNNLRSSNSTFVTRLQAMDGLPKVMADKGRAAGGEMVRWGFWNLGRTFGWGEEGGKMKDPMARVTFSQVPTCHCISPHTVSSDRIDIIVGFASGDLVWLDFILGRYTRINKGGLLNNTAVVAVQFDPRQPQHFIAAFADATIMQFNLFGEDPATTVTQSVLPWKTHFETHIEEARVPLHTDTDKRAGATGSNGEDGGGAESGVFEDSMITWKNDEWAVQLSDKERKAVENRNPFTGKNPCAVTKIGKRNITGMTYSPDGRWLSIISDDGMVRLVDTQEEFLSDTYAGYFSALNCLAWSPDSRFLAVGGQDDLITILSPRESRVVARCQGHSAFVTSIAFDPARGEGRGYRFASVGEDGKLILWDFSAAQLHRPRHHHANSSHHRIAGSTASLQNQGQGRSQSHLPLGAGAAAAARGRYHPAPPRSEVALLQPVMARVVEGNLITSVHMSPQAIVTISRAAGVKWWQRPKRQSQAKGAGSAKNGGMARAETRREIAAAA